MRLFICIAFVVVLNVAALAQTTEFTYQGSLKDGTNPANGNYDLEFNLFDAVSGGVQQGGTLQRLNVAVANGIFTVSLDFGAPTLPGADRFLDIAVRAAGGGAFTPLSPRQKVNSAPYSVRSLNATTADSVAAGGIPAGSENYIQNTTSPQASSNFYISGTGTANIFDALTQYNIGGNRILSNPGYINLFTGAGAGAAITIGSSNAFYGGNAGLSTTSGSVNAFFGALAGQANSTGSSNAFFGSQAGVANTTGSFNSFFGAYAGDENTTGSSNAFFGTDAGTNTDSGLENTFVGTGAGFANGSGNSNTAFGHAANFAGAGLTNANAIGYRAMVFQSNSLVLGSVNGFNGAISDTNVGIGTTAPQYRLHVVGENIRIQGNSASIFPRFSLNFTGGALDARKWQNYATTDALRFSAINDAENAETIWLNVIRSGQSVTNVEFLNGQVAVANKLFVGGTSSSPDQLAVIGTISFSGLGSAGATALCRNASNQISTCSSSLRYKTNIAAFSSGLSFVNKLRPIVFDWKEGGMKDVGFGAEDMAKIDPRFVTYNDKGEVEGVKYDRLSVAFVNAFKEQQTQIERQQALIERLEKRIEQLEKAQSK